VSYQGEDWLIKASHNYPLLTAEQEIQLARQVQAWLAIRHKTKLTKREKAIARKGRRAYETFFLANIRLVASTAGRVIRVAGCLTFEDLMQEGLIGLERAIVKFDHTRGYKFSTYAFNWIRQSINRAITAKSRLIRLPQDCTIHIRNAKAFSDAYEIKHGTQPTIAQVAEHCGITEQTLKVYLMHGKDVMSLDERLNGSAHDERSTYLEMIPAPPSDDNIDIELEMLAAHLDKAITMLPPKQQEIIRRRYGTVDTPSFRAISEEMGITRQATNQHHDSALRSLRVRLAHVRPLDIPTQQYVA
jgi:RNA polymerase sigma factor (sigma-70 family)